MKAQQVIRVAAVLCGALALNGCKAKDETASIVSNYVRPNDWRSECVGRLMVDMPLQSNFGEALPVFTPRGQGQYYTDGKDGLGTGRMSVASQQLLEAMVMGKAENFDAIDGRADGYFEFDAIKRSGYASRAEAAQRAAITTKQPWREPRSFIWRSGPSFDFGIYVPADRRPRMLHGKLSGEGSPAQAKAVVDTLWPRYRVRTPGEVPVDPGICTPYGFFADPKGLTERDYAFDMSLKDARHSNLLLNLEIKTRNQHTTGEELGVAMQKIEDLPTPWAEEDARSKEEREKCRPQQGTASRDLFGCTFAGAKAIKRHRDVQYLSLADGQRARLLVIEYYATLHGYAEYEVSLETLGVPDSATQPRIVVRAIGIPEETTIKGMQGNKPPKIDEAVAIVRNMAASLRLRPGAVDSAAPVKGSLDGVR